MKAPLIKYLNSIGKDPIILPYLCNWIKILFNDISNDFNIDFYDGYLIININPNLDSPAIKKLIFEALIYFNKDL
jgi:hypothetical protein